MATCAKCGADGVAGSFCSYCGAELVSETPPPVNVQVQVQARSSDAVGEQPILTDPANGVTITSARAVIGAQTFAMANVTSVAVKFTPADRGAGAKTLLAGLCLAVCGFSADSTGVGVFGVLVVLVGIALAMGAKETYHVVIGTAGGEVQALSSPDKEQIHRVAAAMNNAIVHRG